MTQGIQIHIVLPGSELDASERLEWRLHNNGYDNTMPYPSYPEAKTMGASERHNMVSNYREAESQIRRIFADDLAAHYVITGEDFANEVFAMAWDAGHSGGYAEVAACYDELIERLLKFFMRKAKS